MADVYLHGHHASVLASHGARTAADSAAYLLPRLREGLRVLDIGCGPGTITLDLAEAVGTTGEVIGIENVAGPLDLGGPPQRRRTR
jgi:ubiquinone/menaquinone biosynthesis C-methylase UbiE